MNQDDNRRHADNLMGAVATLLGGREGHHRDFIDAACVMISGRPPHMIELMQYMDDVGESGRPLIWVHVPVDHPAVPLFGLVVRVNGGVQILESCLLRMDEGDDRARLVPDCLTMGSFRFDDDLVLAPRAEPVRKFDAADPSWQRAYARLLQIATEQWERGDSFDLREADRAA